jgi:outer membrane protein
MMTNLKQTAILAIAMLATTHVDMTAETWTLENCVSYALTHNLSVKARQLNIESGQLQLTEAKDRFLPSLNASAGESLNFGRGLTANNTYADRNTTNFQWGASLQLPLFQGLSEYRQIKVAKSNLQQLLYEHEAAKDNVTLNIISQYLQVLYAKEVYASALSQLSHTTYEVGRQKALLEAGKVPEADLLDAESQKAQDELQVVTSENDIKVSLVELANLLQLPDVGDFDIAPIPEDEPIIPTAESVFNAAMMHNNSILAASQSIKTAEHNISLAKSGYIPRLSFNAGIGSSYYTVGGYVNDPFSAQMKHNFSTYVGVSLSIPIFDAFSTRNSVRQAKLQHLSAQLQLDQQSTDLYKTIQLAYYQACGAREKYLASLSTLEKTRRSFAATQEKYNLGRATPAEFEQAKNNLFRIEISSIQSHYEYLLRHRILIFYQSNRL